MITCPPERLGSFYLGAAYDATQGKVTDTSVNYDSRDLTTHAVCVGMTGSGKTGLCIGLLEEAAIDGVPAIIIDPKGDMTNLMLQFEQLDADDFLPWINVDDAGRKGMTPQAYAQSTAEKWQTGLGEWGQGKERIALLKSSVQYTVYTPGSNAGIPINIMGSFAAPKVDFDSDAEMLRERIQGTVGALLGMINSKEDPVRSREGILLANIFEHFWREGKDLDLASLIMNIQSPPMQTLGVFDIDTFFPQKDRFKLAMDFNSLIASPQFKYWLQGEDLDIDKLYFTSDGKPRHSIIYLAHLSESERMFFVTLLLNSLITWMRAKSGTTSLRSLLYFDEIFGYFPPTANPPSKKPLLTILKQARAYGVGAVMVTQNPVDIDYKGLSNAGTWFIGKLQTERDKQRLLEGLKGAIAESGGSATVDYSKLISSLSSRVFLMHNVHEAEPVLLHTRWAMSYLRGPLTRPQVKQLMLARKENESLSTVSVAAGKTNIAETNNTVEETINTQPPSLDPSIDQRFFAVWKTASEAGLDASANNTITYRAEMVLAGKVRYYNDKRDVDVVENTALLIGPPDDFGRLDWESKRVLKNFERALFTEVDHPSGIPISFDAVPAKINSMKEIDKVSKTFSDWLYKNKSHTVLEHEKTELYQEENESTEGFRMRLQLAAREARDQEIDKLHDSYDSKFRSLEEKIRREERDLDEAKAEKSSRRTDELFNVVETVFGGVFGGRRRKSMNSVSTKRRMARKANEKVNEIREDLESLDEAKLFLEQELRDKINAISRKWESLPEGIIEKEIKPRRSDVVVENVILAWHPFWIDPNGNAYSALG